MNPYLYFTLWGLFVLAVAFGLRLLWVIAAALNIIARCQIAIVRRDK